MPIKNLRCFRRIPLLQLLDLLRGESRILIRLKPFKPLSYIMRHICYVEPACKYFVVLMYSSTLFNSLIIFSVSISVSFRLFCYSLTLGL